MFDIPSVYRQLIYQFLRNKLKELEDLGDQNETTYTENKSFHSGKNNTHHARRADKTLIKSSQTDLKNRKEFVSERFKVIEKLMNNVKESKSMYFSSGNRCQYPQNVVSHNWRKLINGVETELYTYMYMKHIIELVEDPEWKWTHPVWETRKRMLDKLEEVLETESNNQNHFSALWNLKLPLFIPKCNLIDSLLAHYPNKKIRSKKNIRAKASYEKYIRDVVASVSNSKWNFKKTGEFLNKCIHPNLNNYMDLDHDKEEYMKRVIRVVNLSQHALKFPVTFSTKVDLSKGKNRKVNESRNFIFTFLYSIRMFQSNWETPENYKFKFKAMNLKSEAVNYMKQVVETVDNSKFDFTCSINSEARERGVTTSQENKMNTYIKFTNILNYFNNFLLRGLFQNKKQPQAEIMMKYIKNIIKAAEESNLYLSFPVELRKYKNESSDDTQIMNTHCESYIEELIDEVTFCKINLMRGFTFSKDQPVPLETPLLKRDRTERDEHDEIKDHTRRPSHPHISLYDKILSKREFIIRIIASAIAGAVSRTAIAPFEYTRGHFFRTKKPYSFLDAFIYISTTKHKNYRLYWQGHSISIMTVVPEIVVRFVVHDQCKLLLEVQRNKSTPRRVLAGSIAGVAGQTVVYPFEVIRLRYIVKEYGATSYWKKARKVWGEAKLRSLYRGFFANLLTVLPFASVSFFSYDFLKSKYKHRKREKNRENTHEKKVETKRDGKRENKTPMRLVCGLVAGCLGQLAASPFHTVRRKMQFTPYGTEIYRNTWVTFLAMLREDYKGSSGKWKRLKRIAFNSFRGPLVVGLSFATYDYILDVLMITHFH